MSIHYDLASVVQRLADEEIGFTIESIPVTGFDVALGDEMNGFVRRGSFGQSSDIAPFLATSAADCFGLFIEPTQSRGSNNLDGG